MVKEITLLAVRTKAVESSVGNDQNAQSSNAKIEDTIVQKQPVSIFHQLRSLYKEEILNIESQFQSARLSSLLLEKLVRRQKFNMIIITLDSGNESYSVVIHTVDGAFFPVLLENHQPYPHDLLLDYIDKEELPPPLITLWEQTFPDLFYSGCVIAQIKDLRHGSQVHIKHVLLKPHTQSLINDINEITMEANQTWTTDEKLGLESTIFNAIQGPLCLDPSPSAGLKRFHSQRLKSVLSPLQCTVHKQSQEFVFRKRKIEQTALRCTKHLAEFIANKKHTQDGINNSTSVSVTNDHKNKEQDVLLMGSDIVKDVTRVARSIDQPPETNEGKPQLVEQYIFETEKTPNTTNHAELSILQHPSNFEYLGHLYVDKEYKKGETNGASCRFSLGTRAQANNYIKHYKNIFTVEGHRSVRITHVVPGQPDTVTCTAGMYEREAARNAGLLRVNNHPKQRFSQVVAGRTQHIRSNNQKDSVRVTLNGLLSSCNAHSGLCSTTHNMHNGEVRMTSISIPSSLQVGKSSILLNPGTTDSPTSFQNFSHRYQQQSIASENESVAVTNSPALQRNTSGSDIAGSSTKDVYRKRKCQSSKFLKKIDRELAAAVAVVSSSSVNHSISGSPITVTAEVPTTNEINAGSSINNKAIGLLSSSISLSNQALDHLMNQSQQQVAGNGKKTDLRNPLFMPPVPSSSSTLVRVPVQNLPSQLPSSPQNQTVSVGSSNINTPIQSAVNSFNSDIQIKQGSVQKLQNKQTLTGSLPNASVQSVGNVQPIYMISGTDSSDSVSSGGQGLNIMSELSPLLAGK